MLEPTSHHAIQNRPLTRALLVLSCAWLGLAVEPSAARSKKHATADDLMVVDCLLPHKTRRLGRANTFLLPRKPLRTTAIDCRIRGGEYTEPDQASLATALEVWQPQAEAGNAEAQYYVGQIFEKGLGATADPETAAAWYRRAAEQDYAAAQVALGYLFEAGVGVAQDDAEALRWYRRAAGMTEDLVVLARDDYAALIEAREVLETRNAEAERLRAEVEALETEIERLRDEGEQEQARVGTLDTLLGRLRDDLAARDRDITTARERIATLEARPAADAGPAPTTNPTDLAQLSFGNHHALVIGNSSYESLPPTPTGTQDARDLASVLEQRYDFDVTLLLDATRYEIMAALNDLRANLTEDDHLLVYYAGRGVRDTEGQTAYWQPVDADPTSPANWIPSAVVTEHLDIIPARHVFVVADSVYAGLRTRSSAAALPRGMTDEQNYFHIKSLLEKRSRLVLAAGSEAPVADAPTPQASRFTGTVLEVLSQNKGVLEASALYREVNRRLADLPARPRLALDFAALKWARNDLGAFFFVPRSQ